MGRRGNEVRAQWSLSLQNRGKCHLKDRKPTAPMKRGSPRWRAFAAGVCVEAVGGLQYMFGVYSQTIKDHYSLSQQQLTTIATGTEPFSLSICCLLPSAATHSFGALQLATWEATSECTRDSFTI